MLVTNYHDGLITKDLYLWQLSTFTINTRLVAETLVEVLCDQVDHLGYENILPICIRLRDKVKMLTVGNLPLKDKTY